MIRYVMAPAGVVALLIAFGLAATYAIFSSDQLSIEYVSISGDLDERQTVSVKTSLGKLDLDESNVEDIKIKLDAVDWIHHVNVMVDWPSSLVLEVFPEHAIAYWNDNGFINEEGKVLETELLIGGDLPHLYGPVGSEYEVMTQYQQLNRSLSPSGHDIELLALNERGAWVFETSAGLQVLLGKDDLRARVQRFVTVSSRLQENIRQGSVASMDARYINGVAVQFTTLANVSTTEQENRTNNIEVADLNNSVGERSL